MAEKEKKIKAPTKTKAIDPTEPAAQPEAEIAAKVNGANPAKEAASSSPRPSAKAAKPDPVQTATGTTKISTVSKKAAAGKEVAPAPSREQIEQLAHHYWKERGGHHGGHEQDWFRAERELRGKAS
jgi:hypothetical protein